MAILKQDEQKTLKTRFKKELKKELTVNLFSVRTSGLLILPGRECPTCPQSQALLEEVVAVTPKLSLEVYDFYSQPEVAQIQGVERIPCITFSTADKTYSNLKYYGTPSGFEFATLLQDISVISRAVSPLQVPTRKALRQLDKDLHLQVFVTPG